MSLTRGEYQGTCVRRGIPRKYGIVALLALGLLTWVLAVPSHNSYAIKSVIDQCQDQGYTDGMVREVAKLFPDSRALLRARELASPPAPIAQQALTEYDRKALEERLYSTVFDRFTVEGMEIATLLINYVGQMRFKVILSVRTKELPYPRIRQTLQRMRNIIEREILPESFKGFELAELSTFTVLNRRNGRFYEYPVLYQNLSLPYFNGAQDEAPMPNVVPKAVESSASSKGQAARSRFPWGDRPWESRTNDSNPLGHGPVNGAPAAHPGR